MGKVFEAIDEKLADWIEGQHLFSRVSAVGIDARRRLPELE
jgi:hypothetical protein